MSFFKLLPFLGLLPSFILASPVAQEAPWQTATADAPVPESTACGVLMNDINQGYYIVPAVEAYECFATVPFIDAVALRFIDYFNTTIQFQSSLAYLRDPPKSYQQPAVNVLAELEQIKKNITAGYYHNQYEFEATLQSLVYRMHDAHVDLTAGILASFSFGGAYDIMSVSVDGKQPPQIYLRDDIVDSLGGKLYTPSPVVQMNGRDVVQYLTEFAALNSVGMLDPNADWNQLMYSPTQDIQGVYNTFGWQATFYPGDELNYTFANQTVLESEFVALYANPYETGPLTTGGDYYNYFVLGLLPASYNPNQTADVTYVNDTSSTDYSRIGWSNVTAAYPNNPDIVQQDLSVTGGGFITAYFLNDTSTGVISIPSFDQYGDAVGTFSSTVADFITRAKKLNITRIVIDVQQNFGGTSILAMDTFRQFFPSITQYAGSRMRSHDLANVLGGAMTPWWTNLTADNELYEYYKYPLAANEWVVTDRLNAATGKNFTSWPEFYGPLSIHGDYFSLVQRYDLSNPVFDAAAFDGWIPTGYQDGAMVQDPTPFAAKDIVILTDGVCSSTCALFVEMMTYQAGVRTVTVGGRPTNGPMQAIGGSRGAASYDSGVLDANFVFASSINDTAANLLPQVRDPNIYTTYFGFNLRDEVRPNDTEPLQFKYEAANCRIYWTLSNAYNMSRLWRDAASATWDNPSLCVEGSMGYASTGNSTVAKSPPTASNITAGQHASAVSSNIKLTTNGGLPNASTRRSSGSIEPCSDACPGGCNTIACPGGGSRSACLGSCPNVGGECIGGGQCQASQIIESKQRTARGSGAIIRQVVVGKCFPDFGTPAIGCPATGGAVAPPPP